MNSSTRDLDPLEEALSEFFDEVRQSEVAPARTWPQVAERIAARDPGVSPAMAGGRGVPRWLAAGALAAALTLGAFFVLTWSGSDSAANAEAILQYAETTANSPQTAGIERLFVEQHSTAYGSDGAPVSERRVRAWYEAPDRQRAESVWTQNTPEGAVRVEQIQVWDGSEYWTYDPQEQVASVLRQDPGADIYEQGILHGALPPNDTSEIDSSCRDAEVIGEGEVLGRSVDIVELSRPTCGLTFSDGKRRLWVDRERGLVLKAERFELDGRLAAVGEVVVLEINGSFDETLLTFSPPPGTEIGDRRDQPLGIGTRSRLEPRLVSLEEAQSLATFRVRVPSTLPAGFELESVQLWWLGIDDEDRPTVHNDWVLIRYADPDGNWLVISQGFGGLLVGWPSVAPPEIPRGAINVRGAEAQWIDGSPITNDLWEPGAMRVLTIDAGRLGSGWEVAPGGSVQTGSPSHIALASNLLTLEQIVEVAEAME